MNPQEAFVLKDQGLSKLSVSPFISPHRKEAPKSNFMNFRGRMDPKQYMLIDDNHVTLPAQQRDFKRDFAHISDFKDSLNVFAPDIVKTQEKYKFDGMESTKESFYKKSRDDHKRNKIYKKFKSSK